MATFRQVVDRDQTLRFERYAEELGKWFDVVAYGADSQQVVVVFSDISDRKQAEQALARKNRMLHILSNCNQILLRREPEQVLLHSVCEAVTVSGDFPFARLVFDDGSDQLAVGAQCPKPALTDPDDADEPAQRVLRSGRGMQVRVSDEAPRSPWRRAALDCGFRAVLALPLRVSDGRTGALCVYGVDERAFDAEQVELFTQLADDLVIGIDLRRLEREQLHYEAERANGAERLQRALTGAVESVALTIEKRDPYTAGHQRRVARLGGAIAELMGLEPDVVDGIRLGGIIHDIGKIYIPAEILNRPGRLDTVEMNLIKTHPRVGYDIIKGVDFPWPVAAMVLQHHERLDGSGYPQGLKGDDIVLEARVLAVADVVEAITSHRPYRPGLGIEVALGEIEAHRGNYYDPAVVDACLRLFREQGFCFDAA